MTSGSGCTRAWGSPSSPTTSEVTGSPRAAIQVSFRRQMPFRSMPTTRPRRSRFSRDRLASTVTRSASTAEVRAAGRCRWRSLVTQARRSPSSSRPPRRPSTRRISGPATAAAGLFMPSQSNDEMLATVRATHTGYDPLPALRVLSIPTLWLLGTNDRTVPTAACLEILSGLHKANLTVQMLPTGHGLLVNQTGLMADDDRSPGLAPELVPKIGSWLHAM